MKKYAEEVGEETWGKTKVGEQKMKDKHDEEEKKKREEEEKNKKEGRTPLNLCSKLTT